MTRTLCETPIHSTNTPEQVFRLSENLARNRLLHLHQLWSPSWLPVGDHIRPRVRVPEKWHLRGEDVSIASMIDRDSRDPGGDYFLKVPEETKERWLERKREREKKKV
jgi:hypothetical protein